MTGGAPRAGIVVPGNPAVTAAPLAGRAHRVWINSFTKDSPGRCRPVGGWLP